MSSLNFRRLHQIVDKMTLRTQPSDWNAQKGEKASSDNDTTFDNVQHFSMPTLPHLQALLSSLTESGPISTDLMIIDSLATLVDITYSRVNADHHAGIKRAEANRIGFERRQSALAHIVATLVQTAAVTNMAVLVTNYAVTRVRPELEAVLVPALSGNEWDDAMSAKIELFRDWAQAKHHGDLDEGRKYAAARFARVVKSEGMTGQTARDLSRIVAFTIEKVCTR